MKVEFNINEDLLEPKVMIESAELTDEISDLIKYIKSEKKFVLTGIIDDNIEILNEDKMLRFYAEDGKVIGQSVDNKYFLRLPLKDLEKKLGRDFLRISHSEIVNISKVKKIDINFVGTICLTLINGESTYCSRRKVKQIREILGV